MSRWNLYAAAVAFAVSAMPAGGAVILMVGSVTAAPGSTNNTIEIVVKNTGLSSITVGGFNFQITADSDIDFTGAGLLTSAPYIFAGDSFDQANSLPPNSSSGVSLSAGDISNSGNGDILGAGQTAGLALVTFSIPPIAEPGPVSVLLSTDAANTNLSDQNGNSIPIGSFVNGTILVTAVVPEPSTAAMLLAALMGFGAWRAVKNSQP